MGRSDKYWCKFPRAAVPVTRGDPILRSLFVTLCVWANIEDSPAPNGASSILIKAGQIKTTSKELAFDIGCDHKTIPRKLKTLESCGLISISKAYRGVIISVTHLGIDLGFGDGSTNLSVAIDTSKSRIPDATQPQSRFPCIRELEKENKNGGGDARARVIESPPLQISNLIGKGEIEKGDTPPEAGHVLSEHAKALKLRWLVRTQKYARMRVLNDSEVNTAIIEMAMIYSYPELSRILEYLESSPNSKAAKEFITPMDYRQKFFGGLTLLETVFIEATQTPEGKAVEDRKKAEAKELKKRRLEQEESAKRAAEDSRDRPKGWLKTIMQS